MQELIERIRSWEAKSQALEPAEELRNEALFQVNDYANSFLNGLEKAKAFNPGGNHLQKFKITGEPHPIENLLALYKKEIAEKGINAASGSHLGYIPGGGLFTSSLGDYLADVTNEYAGIYYASPGAVALENALIDWIRELFSYPEGAVGNLASGGSIANLIALSAARDKHGIKGEKVNNSVVYLSAQTHHCVTKALRIIGLEDVVLRTIAVDKHSRMLTDELSAAIEEDLSSGLNPFLVVGSAGTTDTGAIDPLLEIGRICEKYRLWFHVDAAYGGFFILAESVRNKFEGIEMSDSLVVDPHKGMFLPYGIGAVLVKDREAVFHSNRSGADYMQDAYRDDLPVNPSDLGPELTKHFRGMRMWLPLQLHGLEPFAACLEEKLDLTRYIRIKLSDLGFSLGPEPDLSVTYFWMDHGADSYAFNRYLLQMIHEDGSSYFSSTLIDGKFVIRSAILSFRTKLSSVDKAVELISKCLTKTRTDFDQAN